MATLRTGTPAPVFLDGPGRLGTPVRAGDVVLDQDEIRGDAVPLPEGGPTALP